MPITRPIHKNENQQPLTIYPILECMGWYKILESYKHKKGTCHDNELLHLERLWPMPLHREQWIALLWLNYDSMRLCRGLLGGRLTWGVGEQERSCLHNLANSHRHKLSAYCVLVMVETDPSKSNVVWRHENMGRYTHTHRVSVCGWQHIRVNMASQTFSMSCKYTYIDSYRQPNKPPQ